MWCVGVWGDVLVHVIVAGYVGLYWWLDFGCVGWVASGRGELCYDGVWMSVFCFVCGLCCF